MSNKAYLDMQLGALFVLDYRAECGGYGIEEGGLAHARVANYGYLELEVVVVQFLLGLR